MDVDDQNNGMALTTDAQRPPHLNTSNIGAGCSQVYGGGGGDGDADWEGHRQHTQALMRTIVLEHSMTRDYLSIEDESSSDGDEGLEDHQREQHKGTADVGYFHDRETKRQIAHHYLCECPICPHRIKASIKEWLLNVAIEPDTPGSMYPEQGSGDISMSSSMFFDTRPQTPGQLLAEMGSQWPVEHTSAPYHEDPNYIPAPLWLLPEGMMPHQLASCIPEESEPASDDGF